MQLNAKSWMRTLVLKMQLTSLQPTEPTDVLHLLFGMFAERFQTKRNKNNVCESTSSASLACMQLHSMDRPPGNHMHG
jgi:hypothetical protein